MKMIYLTLAISASAFADESGYLKNGEAHVVYRDGKKVGEWPSARKPSSMDGSGGEVRIRFDDDGSTRCYSTYRDNSGQPDQVAVGLSCVRRQ